jgi:hypothetical protein
MPHTAVRDSSGQRVDPFGNATSKGVRETRTYRMGPTVKSYVELPGFEHVFLEESYVLAVVARPSEVIFELDVVLTQEHPKYVAPEVGIYLCYWHGRLDFKGVTDLEWTGQGSPPATDASGEIDYGQIDAMTWDVGRFELEGGWGAMNISATTVGLTLHE